MRQVHQSSSTRPPQSTNASRAESIFPGLCLVLLLTTYRSVDILIYLSYMGDPIKKNDVWQGTMALMVLKTLESMGPLHGYGIARRIEQISGDRLSLNYGSIYPALVRLEQEGSIASEWGVSENNRKAKYYRLTVAGRRQLTKELRDWEETTAIVARFLAPKESV